MIKKNLGLIICCSIFVFFFTLSILSATSQQKDMDIIDSKYNELSNKKSVLESAVQSENESVVESVSGLNNERFEQDTEVAETFFTKVSEWKDAKTYIENRNDIMSEYDLSEDSDFMSIFMPPPVTFPLENGETAYEIDEKNINSSFEKVEPYLITISGDKYTYITQVTISTTVSDKTESSSFIAVYTIDSDSNIFDISAYTEK